MKDKGFAKIPFTVCECGKPVVFLNGRKTYKCSRCDIEWKLTVKVEKKNKK